MQVLNIELDVTTSHLSTLLHNHSAIGTPVLSAFLKFDIDYGLNTDP
jgi:hypothetical protein